MGCKANVLEAYKGRGLCFRGRPRRRFLELEPGVTPELAVYSINYEFIARNPINLGYLVLRI